MGNAHNELLVLVSQLLATYHHCHVKATNIMMKKLSAETLCKKTYCTKN